MSVSACGGPALPAYLPSRCFGNRHLMNLTLLVPRRRGALRRAETVLVPVAGGQVACRVSRGPDPAAGTLFLLPGLTGSSRSVYAVGLARKALRRGLHVVCFEPRGCGGTEHLAQPLAHCGLYEDVVAAMQHCAAQLGLRRQCLVGFSMGGNLALRTATLGRSRLRGVDLCGLALVSPAVDIVACAEQIDTTSSLGLYRRRFVQDLTSMLRRHRRAFGLPEQAATLSSLRSIRAFDDHYTAPAWGYACAEDYWRNSGSFELAAQLHLPTLVIAAEDDVLVPWSSLAPLRAAAGQHLRFVGTPRGGHCAFLARLRAAGDPDRHWAENRILDHVVAVTATKPA